MSHLQPLLPLEGYYNADKEGLGRHSFIIPSEKEPISHLDKISMPKFCYREKGYIEERKQVKQSNVVGITHPALDRYRVIYSPLLNEYQTLINVIRNRRIIQQTNPG
jgi:hypothetical protein